MRLRPKSKRVNFPKVGKPLNLAQPSPKNFGDALQWLITFDNPAISEAAKRRIFVFIKLNGQLAGINYTGH